MVTCTQPHLISAIPQRLGKLKVPNPFPSPQTLLSPTFSSAPQQTRWLCCLLSILHHPLERGPPGQGLDLFQVLPHPQSRGGLAQRR
jgi:hypothetical protein